MRNSDGEERSRDGENVQPAHYGYENFDGSVQQRRRARRGQLQKDDEKQDVRSFICMFAGCVRTFTSRFKLIRHILIHSGERRFKCASCDRRFHRKDHLKNHLNVHNPNKIIHACQLCRKTYCSVLSYRKHIAIHAAEAGDLSCKLCGKMMADRDSIMHHLKVHTGSRTLRGPGERKYPCDICDRKFFTKKDVKRHLVVHTGKRDFVCQFCPQRFGRKDHLVRHTKKSHTDIGHNSNNSCSPPIEPLRKYDPPPPLPSENHKNGSVVVPTSLNDISGLVVSGAVTPMMENLSLDTKPDSLYAMAPPPNLVQSSYNLSPLSNDGNQNLGKFPESSLLPVSQYLPMPQSYPTVTPVTPITPVMPHHYLNMPTSNNVLSDLLPPMSIASSFSSSLQMLDPPNPSLPHFNQAFQ